MATHIPRAEGDSGATLPEAVPIDLPHLTRLSWELGSRITEDDESTRCGTWEGTETPWTLSIFRVTGNTVLLAVHTPVGRERFYGAARSDLEAVLPRLETAPHWRRVD